MMKPEKYVNFQMGLFDEWERSQMVKGTDVFSIRSGLVRREWLSRCRKGRALTQDLMSEIADLKNFDTAWRRVISNKGSAGIDGMSVEELGGWFSNQYRELQHQLTMGTYRVTAAKEVLIPKPNGGKRQLGIPTVKDRLVQQAISQVLSKRYDSTFSDHSYGFRPKRNAHQALRKAGDHVAEGKNWIVDIDLAKFFDEVNHDRLLWQLGTRTGDKHVLKLIGKFLRAGMLSGGMTNQRVKGTPQGSPLSPLLSNIVLDELDKELERRGHCFVRYADDIIIMVRSELASERVIKSRLGNIEGWLRRRLRCYRLKQCKRALGIARLLTKLGVPWNRSWTTAGSSKGWFRLSMTHAAHEGMNLEWFKKTGLYSLTANYS